MDNTDETMKKINQFHEHLDVCKQCENHPFDLCPIGANLLKSAATIKSEVLNG